MGGARLQKSSKCPRAGLGAHRVPPVRLSLVPWHLCFIVFIFSSVFGLPAQLPFIEHLFDRFSRLEAALRLPALPMVTADWAGLVRVAASRGTQMGRYLR